MPVTRIPGTLIRDGTLTDDDVHPDNIDGVPSEPSLRTLGTGPQQAAAGDDPRLVTFVDAEVPSGTIDGANNTFTLVNSPTPGNSLKLYLNGVLMRPGALEDYELSGSTITFNGGQLPQTGDTLIAYYRIP